MLLTLLDNPAETSSVETSKFLQFKKFKLTCIYFSQVTVIQEVELSNFKIVWYKGEFSVMSKYFLSLYYIQSKSTTIWLIRAIDIHSLPLQM